MQNLAGRLVHSASDLNAYSECVHLSALERQVADGILRRPVRDDPTAELLARKGDQHERTHLERLRTRHGARLVAFEERPVPTVEGYLEAERESIAAMQCGAAVIYQATFFDGVFLGRADFLQRVERPSARWAWSYEVIDTKLALSPKPYFLIQLCNYSEHVARIQGVEPENASIVLGNGETRHFRVAEYAAYYRRLKAAYLAAMAAREDACPLQCAHCDLCTWRDVCAKRRDADDHLSLVAGIRRDQIEKLERAEITTLHALAIAGQDARPKRLSAETFANLRAQAAEQHRYRAARGDGAVHSYTFRQTEDPASGFARLPEPNAGDVFFDIEGDPMYRPDRGLEYLFGAYLPHENRYMAFWATSSSEERAAFEGFIDFVVARRARFPGLHVYHYAPYETTALKRLMGRFGSREREVDDFLRAGTFIDLYPIVKQSIWISQPSYSIKKVEALYGFTRSTATRGGDDSIVNFESWLETQDPETLEDIRAYNEDDCRSTYALREWLVRLRAERNTMLSSPVAWRAAQPPPPPSADADRGDLEARLLDGIVAPDSLAELDAAADASRERWLLGNLLQYHRREQKPEWWEHFQRLEHASELVDGDDKSLGGLRHCDDIPAYKLSAADRTLVYTFTFPPQEHGMRPGDTPLDAATRKTAGTLVTIDDKQCRLEIKLARAVDPAYLRALIPAKPLDDRKKRAAIEAIASGYLAGTLAEQHPATLALLSRSLPRLRDRRPGARVQPAIVTAEAVSALVAQLDGSYLTVQGPPGSGKSTTGAQAIVDLLTAGKRVALAAQSHKALHNLLHKVEETAVERGVTFAGCHKSTPTNAGSTFTSRYTAALAVDSPAVAGYAGCNLVSATTFAWAEPDQRAAFDVVFIEEAGQISLADALVTSLVAHDVVLLGDPQQLPQVSTGSHPIGTDRSILEHLLCGDATVRVERGVFLDRSYRMQPAINSFVSRAFYEGRLEAHPRNAANTIRLGNTCSAGVRCIEIAHDGAARRSTDEAQFIANRIAEMLDGGRVELHGAAARRLTESDILVVAPYNAQRAEIGRLLAARGLNAVAVGTVDKFQGQEAPVVFYSMTTSSAELAPRGLDFLLSPNRLNVAISRAQALSVVVCSPFLLSSRATTIEHMQLLNRLCLYVETAERGGGDELVSVPHAPRELTLFSG